MKKLLACLLVLATTGCPDVKKDPGEGPGEITNGPTVEFDPANAIIPFPNNLVIDPATGKVNIPAPACETPAAKAVREGVLNQLDGFGTFEAGMQVTFTDDVDMATVNSQTVVMYQRTKDGAPVTSPTPVPVTILPSSALRFDKNNCTAAPAQVHAITIVPTVPLEQRSTYTVALLSGVKTTGGKDYEPSFTWALIRQTKDPVTLADGCDYNNPTSCTVVSEQTPLTPGGDANGNGVPDVVELVGLDQLWRAEAQALALLDPTIGNDRSKVLVAWEVTTQTTTDPLDPAVAGSPASLLLSGPILGVQSLVCDSAAPTCPNGYPHGQGPYAQCANSESDAECFLEIALGAGNYTTGRALCTQIGCAAVGDVLAGAVPGANYQVPGPNPLAGGAMVPGPWADPVHPSAPQTELIQVLAFVPAGSAGPYPTVIFGHGLGRSKTDLFAIAPQLAANGYASIAIDFVASGSRAVQTSNDAAIGCSGTPSATAAPQCFAPILSTNLGTTRDNIRQTVLDLERLANAIAGCGATGCRSANSAGNLNVDPTKIEYMGQSLGGIIGSVFTAVEPKVKASVLNVAAMGWLDVLEHTENLTIRCSLVNGLIDAGILVGDKWDPQANTGLCTTDAWQMQPGYQQFSGIARIVLDPADPANFSGMLATRRFLLQEVVGDQVVPNYATEHEGQLTGLTAMDADLYLPTVDTAPSMALTAMPLMNHWLLYKPIAASAQTGPGNEFQHGSLLAPAQGQAGQLGTARMQTDAIYFLFANK
jgi:dienelactone hydrolase